MTDAGISSANPRALQAYAEVADRIAADLERSGIRLAGTLDEFAATCREYPLGIDGSLADLLRGHARRQIEQDQWVRRVAEQFELADRSGSPSKGVDGLNGSAAATGQINPGEGLLQLILAGLPPEVAAQFVELWNSGSLLGALTLAGVVPGAGGSASVLADAPQNSSGSPLDWLGRIGGGAIDQLGATRDGVQQWVNGVESDVEQAWTRFAAEHPTTVRIAGDVLGAAGDAASTTPPPDCATDTVMFAQQAADAAAGNRPPQDVNPALAGNAAVHCYGLVSAQPVYETTSGAAVAGPPAFFPKNLLDALGAAFNHAGDGHPPRGNGMVEPSDTAADGKAGAAGATNRGTGTTAAADAASAKAERLEPLADQIAASNRAYDRATEPNAKPVGKDFADKTTASDDLQTLSGWTQPRPDGFAGKSPDEIRAYSDQIGHDLRASGRFDQIDRGGWSGKYQASHAEKQGALVSPDDPLGVSKEMCTDCQDFFSRHAQQRGRPQIVTDPKVTRIFWPDGLVDEIDRQVARLGSPQPAGV
jgi:hypothetical protein